MRELKIYKQKLKKEKNNMILYLSFKTIDEVTEFISVANEFKGKVYLQKNEYIVDAKNPLGVYSLDSSLSKFVTFRYDEEISDDLYNKINKFSIE